MRILLFGDHCTDLFVYGDCPRLSPEAPVVIFHEKSRVANPGMAGNVLANIESLCPSANVCGIFPEASPVKIRYVDRRTGHHFLRVDNDFAVTPLVALHSFFDTDAVVISDYAKGFLNVEALQHIGNGCTDIPLFVDTKQLLGSWSRNAIVKINEAEFNAHLLEDLEPWRLCRHLIVTRGGDGMDLYAPTGAILAHLPAHGVSEVRDGAGCGDSVLAGLVVAYLENGGDLLKAMEFANKVGAVAVSKRGVVAVKREEVV